MENQDADRLARHVTPEESTDPNEVVGTLINGKLVIGTAGDVRLLADVLGEVL